MLSGQGSRAQLDALCRAIDLLDLTLLAEVREVVGAFEVVAASWQQHFAALRTLEGLDGFLAWASFVRAALMLARRVDAELRRGAADERSAALRSLAARASAAHRRLAEIPAAELRKLRVAA